MPSLICILFLFVGDGSVLNVFRYKLKDQAPPIRETLSLGESARRALIGLYGRLNNGLQSSNLSGKNEDGTPSKGDAHAHYIPTDENHDGFIDHLTVYSRTPFTSPSEIQTLESFEYLRLPDGNLARAELTGKGSQKEFYDSCLLFRPSPFWVSATPFFPSRHLKRRGILRDQCGKDAFHAAALLEELDCLGFPAPTHLLELPAQPGEDIGQEEGVLSRFLKRSAPESFSNFVSERRFGQGNRGTSAGKGFVLVFPGDVAGPLFAGYASHFGLGLFVSGL